MSTEERVFHYVEFAAGAADAVDVDAGGHGGDVDDDVVVGGLQHVLLNQLTFDIVDAHELRGLD